MWKGLCPGQPQTQPKANPPLQAPSRGMDPSSGRKGSGANLNFLLSQQVNEAPSSFLSCLPQHRFPQLSYHHDQHLQTTSSSFAGESPTTFHPSKAEPCRYPEPPSRKSAERKGQAGTEIIINQFCCFTRLSVVPCCPIPRPGRAYPRTSLLFWANQTQPGYTLTALQIRLRCPGGCSGMS